MRAFVILCCVATAYAAGLGYDYNGPADGGSSGGFSGGFSGGSSGGFSGGSSGGFSGGSSGGFSGGSSGGIVSGTFGGVGEGATGSFGGSSGGFSSGIGSGSFGGVSDGASGSLGGSSAGGYGGSSYGGSGYGGQSYSAGPAEYTKEFFTYTAPEHEFHAGADNGQITESLKKSLRVIFIKGPESSGIEHAALHLAKSAADERTAIYVLNKQADIGDLANKLQQLNSHNANKPEVHFVKYRTPADAEHAQRTIESQYNSLGGHSSSHNGGVAPVLDFASKAPVAAVHGGASYGGNYGGSVENAYLPPNKRV